MGSSPKKRVGLHPKTRVVLHPKSYPKSRVGFHTKTRVGLHQKITVGSHPKTRMDSHSKTKVGSNPQTYPKPVWILTPKPGWVLIPKPGWVFTPKPGWILTPNPLSTTGRPLLGYPLSGGAIPAWNVPSLCGICPRTAGTVREPRCHGRDESQRAQGILHFPSPVSWPGPQLIPVSTWHPFQNPNKPHKPAAESLCLQMELHKFPPARSLRGGAGLKIPFLGANTHLGGAASPCPAAPFKMGLLGLPESGGAGAALPQSSPGCRFTQQSRLCGLRQRPKERSGCQPSSPRLPPEPFRGSFTLWMHQKRRSGQGVAF